MHNKQEIKPTPCPECGHDLVFEKNTIIEHIIKYKAISCGHCQNNFAFNPVTVFIFLMFTLTLCSLGLAVNFYMPYLQDLKHTYPYLKVYAMLALVGIILITTMLFKYFTPLLVKWQQGNAIRYALHYATLCFAGISFSLVIYQALNGF